MDAEQLWETTLNPETRILKQVEIEDGRLASEVTSMLMGSEVPPRREFIHTHAKDADLDLQNNVRSEFFLVKSNKERF